MSIWFKSLEAFYFWTSRPKIQFRYKYKFCKDEPEELEQKVIYIIGEHPYLWKICFRCPCGCNEVISLNLLKEANPRWRFTIRWRKISIYPSIWRKVGCKSHFYIKKGKVNWSYV
jgi:hypothetical protein